MHLRVQVTVLVLKENLNVQEYLHIVMFVWTTQALNVVIIVFRALNVEQEHACKLADVVEDHHPHNALVHSKELFLQDAKTPNH
jgi:hypothetical protein